MSQNNKKKKNKKQGMLVFAKKTQKKCARTLVPEANIEFFRKKIKTKIWKFQTTALFLIIEMVIVGYSSTVNNKISYLKPLVWLKNSKICDNVLFGT